MTQMIMMFADKSYYNHKNPRHPRSIERKIVNKHI